MKKVICSVVLLSVSALSTGCARTMEMIDPFDAFREDAPGRFLISADAEGMRAWSDYQAGVATNAKASNDAKETPYYELRRRHVEARYGNRSKSNYQKAMESRESSAPGEAPQMLPPMNPQKF